MTGFTFAALEPLMADVLLTVAILFLLAFDVMGGRRTARWVGPLALVELLLIFASTFVLDLSGSALGGAYDGDPLALFFKRLFLATGALSILGSLTQVDRDYKGRQGEYFILLLCSIQGMSLLAGTKDLVLLAVPLS